MDYIKEKFRKNGFTYNLLQRTDKWCLYETEYSYEVMKIKLRFNKYQNGECLPNNELFGKEGSRSFNKKYYGLALSYYNSKINIT